MSMKVSVIKTERPQLTDDIRDEIRASEQTILKNMESVLLEDNFDDESILDTSVIHIDPGQFFLGREPTGSTVLYARIETDKRQVTVSVISKVHSAGKSVLYDIVVNSDIYDLIGSAFSVRDPKEHIIGDIVLPEIEGYVSRVLILVDTQKKNDYPSTITELLDTVSDMLQIHRDTYSQLTLMNKLVQASLEEAFAVE